MNLKHPAVPYVAPMAVFLALLAMGGIPGLGTAEYPARVVLLAAVIWYFSRTLVAEMRVTQWAGSIALGLAVFVIWVAPDVLWPGYREHWIFQNSLTGQVASSVPESYRADSMVLLFRALRASIIVPIVEELFWRGWLMRWLIRNDFMTVKLGEYARDAFWICAALFALEHGAFWEVGLIAGAAYNWWMVRTKSLGDCVLAHGVTNAVLSAYTVFGGHWQYW